MRADGDGNGFRLRIYLQRNDAHYICSLRCQSPKSLLGNHQPRELLETETSLPSQSDCDILRSDQPHFQHDFANLLLCVCGIVRPHFQGRMYLLSRHFPKLGQNPTKLSVLQLRRVNFEVNFWHIYLYLSIR